MSAAQRNVGDQARAILEYWFSSLDDTSILDRTTEPFAACFARWYGKRPEIDDEIRARFESDLMLVAGDGTRWDDELAAWSRAPNGLLALVILLDQLPRNMYRDTAGMYTHDPLALATASIAIREYETAPLSLVQRMFLYVPLMHAENLTLQETMVRRFTGLVELSTLRSPQNRDFFAFALDYAKRHRDVIATYGRFPHRNAILGRRDTEAERAFLETDKAGF
jgi:uncharacterized protein (DUF924 family)